MAIRSPKPNPPARVQHDDWSRVTYRSQPEPRGSANYLVIALVLVALAVLCVTGFLVVRVLLPNRPPVILPAFITETAANSPTPSQSVPSAAPSVLAGSGAPQVSINPTSGYVNTLITVGGEGWWPNEAVFVFLRSPEEGEGRGYAYAAALTDEDGRFRTAVTFPNEVRWLGQAWADVIGRGNRSGLEASTRFALNPPTPTATLPPPTLRPTQPDTPTPWPTDTPWPTETPLPTATPTPDVVITDWRGEYYANPAVSGEPALVRNDVAIDFNWGAGSPGAGMPIDQFSARWTRILYFEEGQYRIVVRSDDGVRFWIDGQLVVDEWHDSSGDTYVVDVPLTSRNHSLQLDFYEHVGGALVQLVWTKLEPPTPTLPPTATPTATPTLTPAPIRPTDTPEPPVTEVWRAEYFANPVLGGPPALIRMEPDLELDWALDSPGQEIPVDGFSARFTRDIVVPSGLYRVYLQVDDGARVWLDGQLLIDEWHAYTGETYVAEIELPMGVHRMRVDYYEDVSVAHIRLWMERVR